MSIDHSELASGKRAYEQTLQTLLLAAGSTDRNAEGHSNRVARFSVAIASVLGLSSEEISNLKNAAGLHDIGKINISRALLHKMGKLTEEEFVVMKRHSQMALHLLDKVDGLQNAIPIIAHHHERFDGLGYPDGISGEDIPLGSRIVAVAEAFDILTSDVPWRDALSREAALRELDRCAGTQFDSRVTKAFRVAIENGFVER